MSEVIVFESSDAGVDVRVMLDGDTVWLSQAQMVELFGRERSVITKHIRKVIADGELDEKEVSAKFAHTTKHGNKRSSAFLFIDFLNQNGRLLDRKGNPIINDIGMAALALLVAESAPESKETMIRLIMNMIAQGDC